MRSFLQNKISEDNSEKIKGREKNAILFQEIARIGQQSEKQGSALSGLNQQIEQRIQYLE